MPLCPLCNCELGKPPEDAREWFRCQNCGGALKAPSGLANVLFWVSIFASGRFGLVSPDGELSSSLAGTIYAALIRFFWKANLLRPQPYSPYSSLGLTDSNRNPR